jgi:hypothetical protein
MNHKMNRQGAKAAKIILIVIPAKAGIHDEAGAGRWMDSRFRRNDENASWRLGGSRK